MIAPHRSVPALVLSLGLAGLALPAHAAPVSADVPPASSDGVDRVTPPPSGDGQVTPLERPHEGPPDVGAAPSVQAVEPVPVQGTPPATEAATPVQSTPPATEAATPSGESPSVEASPQSQAAPAAQELEEPPPDPEALRRSGAHLRPARESELLREHEVAGGKAVYKPGLGLLVESANERFSLATRLRAQFRYTANAGPEGQNAGHSLQIRRARLQFKGHFWSKHIRYKTELAFSPRDMGWKDGSARYTPILDWYLDFTYLRDLSLRIGQYKVPFSRQRVISSGNLQLVDRSIANGEFNLDRDIGVDLRSKDLFGLGRLRYYAGVYMGEGRDNFETKGFDLFYLARVEFLPFGLFNDYHEADFERSLNPRLSLGAAYAFVDDATNNRGIKGSVPSDGGTTDYHIATVDAVFKIAGWSVFADAFYRQGKRDFGEATVEDEMGNVVPAEREASRNGFGWNVQSGYLLPRTSFELAGRYSQVRPLETSSIKAQDEAGGGLSYYLGGHPMKLQADYFARFTEMQWLRPNHEIRIQLQAAF